MHYAEQLARDYGYNLLLVSNQPAELEIAAERLQSTYKIRVQTLDLDLSLTDAAEQVWAFTQEEKMQVEVLINNAGMLIFDSFNSVDTSRLKTLLSLHTMTVCKLCRLFGEAMVARGKGFILNMSSMTAWTALPTIQTYNATKNFVLQFSRSLWYEMQPHGVHVLAVTPGSTNTGMLPFPEKLGRIFLRTGVTQEPEALVRKALKRLFFSKKKVFLPGVWNRMAVPLLKHLPDWLVLALYKRFESMSRKRIMAVM